LELKKSITYSDRNCRYFNMSGAKNTADTLEAVAKRAKELNINKIIIPTHTGRSALAAAKIIPPAKIVAVTTAAGYGKPNTQAMKDTTRQKLMSLGIPVLTCTHAFGGVGRSVRKKLNSYQVDEIIAYALRIFGHGTKVAIETTLMAADAGYVRTDEDIISTGGSSAGLDTALVLQPVNASSFLDLKVREIICKPLDF
jgi:uncharacterized protein